ncbi:NUDIX domain-containing protein [Clostridium sp. MCC353]|uniref:NUDIX domain-containing protein n=1 Tax=Clostridium sp. MCC353 TaxID=2592646 RepID=UPI001C024C06|nr:NUDIX hydrolase [Clostridium sp. MCC353]MBT9775388.1 NUDIX domain-containing protein [Clostridium sp. MCC353]
MEAATAGGSALKGEDKYACVKRELLEETGISEDHFEEIGKYICDDNRCIYYNFLCITSCEKNHIIIQEGETVSYQWITEQEFIEFINSDKIIDGQKKRYSNYFSQKGYLPPLP